MAYHAISYKAAVVNRTVERARRALPINQYLFMLHTGAVTGYFPRLGEDGEPLPRDVDGKDDLCVSDRVDLTLRLLGKSMPDAKYAHDADEIDAKEVRVEDVRDLPSEKLLRLLEPNPKARGIEGQLATVSVRTI